MLSELRLVGTDNACLVSRRNDEIPDRERLLMDDVELGVGDDLIEFRFFVTDPGHDLGGRSLGRDLLAFASLVLSRSRLGCTRRARFSGRWCGGARRFLLCAA